MLPDFDSDIIVSGFQGTFATPDNISFSAVLNDSRILVVYDQFSKVRAIWPLAEVSLICRI